MTSSLPAAGVILDRYQRQIDGLCKDCGTALGPSGLPLCTECATERYGEDEGRGDYEPADEKEAA